MRRMILSSLVLLPVLLNAEVRKGSEPRQSDSSAGFVAEMRQPAGLAEVAMAAAEIKEAASVTESVQTKVGGQFAESALRSGGTLEYSFRTTEPVSTSPKVTRAVEVELSEAELSKQPAVTNVVVSATVDGQGVPHDVHIAKSAGTVVDQRAIAAVNQYRFTPAMVDHQATWAQVSITIRIQKKQ